MGIKTVYNTPSVSLLYKQFLRRLLRALMLFFPSMPPSLLAVF